MSLFNVSMKHCYKKVNLPCLSSYFQIHISSKKFCSKGLASEGNTTTAKKKTHVPKISLISGSSLTITTLEEAQKLSKRRDLKLVKIIDLDTKTQRPIYKLMTGSEYHQEDLKQREERKKQKNSLIKGEKILLLNDKISDHDLQVQGNKVLKWLSKSYQVNVSISSTNTEHTERVFSSLEKFVKDAGRILQKRTKGSDLKFQVIPPKKETENDL